METNIDRERAPLRGHSVSELKKIVTNLTPGGDMSAELTKSSVFEMLRTGEDRFNQIGLMIWGQLPLAIKLSGKDTGGQILIFEHRDMTKGGPPRHMHFEQDEWFYVLKGRYAFEIGEKQFVLGSGETLFAPRKVAHGWACISDEPGTLLTAVTPVGSFEEFILGTTTTDRVPAQSDLEKIFSSHEMQLVGPPLIS